MTSETKATDKPGDPADRGVPEDNFGNVQTHATHSHRAGYGDDRLARLVAWLRAHPTTTLASGEGALLLGEIDRLLAAAKDSADHYADARAEIDRMRRILAALREPSERLVNIAYDVNYCFNMRRALSAAVGAAEQEVGP